MKKTILITMILFFFVCESEDETKENLGACINHFIYDWGSNYNFESCYNDMTEKSCYDLPIDDGKSYSIWESGSTCENEGYTKGCGGKFVAEDEDC